MTDRSQEPESSPEVSVVVATHNRARLLPRLVDCLERQRKVGPFELLIVDDCSSDDTWEVLQDLARRSRVSVRPLQTTTNLGPASARNLGWRSARAPLVAFTDDDCRPASDWLFRLVAPLDRVDVVQGCTEADPNEAADRGPFARVQIVNQWSGLFECCNIAYRRSALERVGGFDESFRRPFGEDVDLGWRAVEDGASVQWEPEALVLHDVETSGDRVRDWVAWVKDTKRRVYAPLMVRKHPGLRDQLHRRWFYKAHHPPTLIALGGLALLGWRRGGRGRFVAAAAMALPWLLHRTVRSPYPSRRVYYPVVLPMAFVSDAVEVGVMVVGSFRFGAVVL
jgi:glycosyltransferase involved in cell wall biosynthesis